MHSKSRFALACLSLFALSAQAENLIVGVEAIDQFPIYRGEGNEYSGFGRELLDDFATKYKHKLTYSPLPILRLHDELLKSKGVDLKFPDNLEWNPDMRKGVTVAYSKPVLVVTEGLSVLPAHKGRGLDKVKTIGAMRGFTPWQYLDAIKAKKMVFSEVTTFDALVKMAESQRIDGLFANTYVVSYYLKSTRKQPELLVFDDTLPYTQTPFHLSSVKHPKVVAEFDEYLVKEKATVDKLKAKYGITK